MTISGHFTLEVDELNIEFVEPITFVVSASSDEEMWQLAEKEAKTLAFIGGKVREHTLYLSNVSSCK